jgi:hypothetical protein
VASIKVHTQEHPPQTLRHRDTQRDTYTHTHTHTYTHRHRDTETHTYTQRHIHTQSDLRGPMNRMRVMPSFVASS